MTVTATSKGKIVGKVIADICRAYQVNGWEFIEVWGKKSWGKTTIALLFLGEFFNWDWDEVFDHHLCFTLEQFAQLMVRARDIGKRNPVILWDDAAVFMGKYRWNEEAVQEFSEFFTGIRTYLNCLIVTSPRPDQLVKGLRDDFTKKIEITRPIWSGRGQFYYQNLIWYDNYYGPGIKERKHLKEYGTFHPLPKEVYERYTVLRKKYLGEVKLDKFLDALAKRAQPEITDDDIKVLEHIDRKGVFTARQFQGNKKWAPYRKNLYKLKALGLLETRDEKISLTSLGRRVCKERQEEIERKLFKNLKKD